MLGDARHGRSYTSGTGSASFSSVAVSKFMDDMQERFISMLLALAGHLNLLASTLQMNLYLGPGCTMSSNMTTDPMVQPFGPPPHAPNSMFAFSMIRAKTNEFLGAVRAGFQKVVNEMLLSGVAILVIDMRVGDTHHTNQTLRFIPHPVSGRGCCSTSGDSPSTHAPSESDDSGNGGGCKIKTEAAPMDVVSVSLPASMPLSTSVVADSDADDSTLSDDPVMSDSDDGSVSGNDVNSQGAIEFSYIPKGTPQWFSRFSD